MADFSFFKMNKRGAITWEQVVYAILAAVAVIALLLIFTDLLDPVKSVFSNIVTSAETQGSGISGDLDKLFDPEPS